MAQPPPPGPRPELFEFAFEAAHHTLTTIEDLIADIERLVWQHESALDSATVDFGGRTRERFDHAFTSVMGELEGLTSRLASQLGRVETAVGLARYQREASLEARSVWTRRRDLWADVRREG